MEAGRGEEKGGREAAGGGLERVRQAPGCGALSCRLLTLVPGAVARPGPGEVGVRGSGGLTETCWRVPGCPVAADLSLGTEDIWWFGGSGAGSCLLSPPRRSGVRGCALHTPPRQLHFLAKETAGSRRNCSPRPLSLRFRCRIVTGPEGSLSESWREEGEGCPHCKQRLRQTPARRNDPAPVRPASAPGQGRGPLRTCSGPAG